MEKPNETVEETVVERTVKETASGARLVFSLAFMAIGLAFVILALLAGSQLGLRIPLLLGGIALIGGFGYVVVGAGRVGGAKGVPGAEIPQGSTVTTTVTKTGFPKQGKSPLAIDENEDEEARPSDDPDSGGSGDFRA